MQRRLSFILIARFLSRTHRPSMYLSDQSTHTRIIRLLVGLPLNCGYISLVSVACFSTHHHRRHFLRPVALVVSLGSRAELLAR